MLRSTMCELENSTSTAFKIFSVVALILFFGVTYPIILYKEFKVNTISNPSTANLRRFNSEIIMKIFIPIIIITNSNEVLINITVAFFILLSLSALIRTPTFGIGLSRFRRAVVAAVSAACLIRICGLASSDPRGSVLAELISIIGFVALA